MRYYSPMGWKRDDLEILDIGCGASPQVDTYEGKVTGLDWSSGKIVFLRSKVETPSLVVGEACTLPFRSSSFDRVIICEVLEHLIAPETCLKEASRVLKSGGICIVATPNSSSLLWRLIERVDTWVNKDGHCDDHVCGYSPSSLKGSLEYHGMFGLDLSKVGYCDMVASFRKYY
jgi:ubiquinone/menaquinone biosynthesis C-methylase UbiE